MELDRDISSIQEARNLVKAAAKAEEVFKGFTQAQVDTIVNAMREAAEANACRLAQMAVSETGMGKYEDKCFKNFFAARYVFEYIQEMKTVGIIREDKANRIWEIAEPVGVIAGIVPTTNPTSTVIYKSLIALKARNAIVFSPHPNAVRCTNEAARIMHEAAVAAGAPEGIIGCLSTVTMAATQELMKHPDTALILATGGSGLVRAAYSSGKPAIGVGPGNVPAFVERSADLRKAARDIITGRPVDTGTSCASEQAIVVEECVADELIGYLKEYGAYFLNPEETAKVSSVVMLPDGGMNPKAVGKDARVIAQMAGFTVPEGTRCLIAPLGGVGPEWPLSHEKLCPVLGFYRVRDWREGCERCIQLLREGGLGHSLVIHSNNQEVIREFALKKPIFRIVVNTPSTLGAIGATTALAPSLTLGCGTWGGSSVSENVSPLHLLNIKRVAWPIRDVERPRVEPPQSCESACEAATSAGRTALEKGIDPEMVREIVSQVLKAMGKIPV